MLRQKAENFAKYIPNYPQEIREKVLHFLQGENREKEKYGLLLDVGCGTGEATKIFAPYFAKVVGIDIKLDLVEAAREMNPFHHVTFEEGRAESLEVAEDATVDMVLAASSVQWFDFESFWSETLRVLKPGGCLALIGYWMPEVLPSDYEGDKAALQRSNNQLFRETFQAEIQDEWDSYKAVVDGYSEIFEKIPTEDKGRYAKVITRDQWTMDHLEGFLRSLDVVNSFNRKKLRELMLEKGRLTDEDERQADKVTPLLKRLAKTWGFDDPNDPRIVLKAQFHFFLVVARKPPTKSKKENKGLLKNYVRHLSGTVTQ